MLYLKTNEMDKAQDCFIAALYQNPNDVAPLLGMAYIFHKKNMKKDFDDIVYHINSITDEFDIDQEMKEFEQPIIDPNPFEICDFDCKSKNKPHLCKKCFFGYVPGDLFIRHITDDMV
jgi:hypothetical protein